MNNRDSASLPALFVLGIVALYLYLSTEGLPSVSLFLSQNGF